MGDGKKELTARHREFCRKYILWHNAARAYREAGFNPKNAHVASVAASRLLANVGIQAEIARQRAQMAPMVTAEWCVRQLQENLERCIELENVAAANKAIEILGRIPNAFPQKVEMDANVQSEITFIDDSDDPEPEDEEAHPSPNGRSHG